MALSEQDLNNHPEPLQEANINISAYRVLYILLMLVQYRSLSGMELNGFLYDNPLIQRIYNTETLTKYINTLREVGCHIPRSSSKNDYSYELLQNPFSLGISPEERRVALKLLALIEAQADENLAEDYRTLLEKLSWSLTEPLKLPPPGKPVQTDAERADQRALFKRYQRYCREGFMLNLSLREGTELEIEPYDVLEQGGHCMLIGLDAESHAQQAIDLSDIRSVQAMPTKNRGQARQTTVTFALYGRLSKTYRPYPGEKIVFSNAERIHVKTRVLETTGLINRLLKYGEACQILSPEPAREAIRTRLKTLLSAFEQND